MRRHQSLQMNKTLLIRSRPLQELGAQEAYIAALERDTLREHHLEFSRSILMIRVKS